MKYRKYCGYLEIFLEVDAFSEENAKAKLASMLGSYLETQECEFVVWELPSATPTADKDSQG